MSSNFKVTVAAVAAIVAIAPSVADAEIEGRLSYSNAHAMEGIGGCRFTVTALTEPKAIDPKLIGQTQGRSKIASAGALVDVDQWTGDQQRLYGQPTAVLQPNRGCRFVRVLAYSTDMTGIDADKVVDAGFSKPIACLPKNLRAAANEEFRRRKGPVGKTMLIGVTKRYTDGTYEAKALYDWDDERRQSERTHFSPACYSTHSPDGPQG